MLNIGSVDSPALTLGSYSELDSLLSCWALGLWLVGGEWFMGCAGRMVGVEVVWNNWKEDGSGGRDGGPGDQS
jgi:hypothetical protein